MKFSDHGIPILPLKEKIEALEAMIREDAWEDALGHLFDLINYVAPGYSRGPFQGIGDLAAYYGRNPTPIEDERNG